jgi:hypothetical protein
VLVALSLCFLSAFATPYGWRYPLQFFTVDLPAIDLAAVREYDSIFAPSQRGLRYVEYGVMMATLLVTLTVGVVRRHRLESSLVLTNLLFAGLFVYYSRLTPFWPVIVLFSGITLLGHKAPWLNPVGARPRLVLGASIVAGGVLLAANAIRADQTRPAVGSWQGFGNSYWNPEEEAEYIARYFADARVGNDYNAGSYLAWRLWPHNKVFIDARYFPYRSWFQDYLQLENPATIPNVLRKYPADLWCIEYVFQQTVAWFRTSPDWIPAFYGASAVVFVKRGTALPAGHLQAGEGLDNIRNLFQALLVTAFAIDVADFESAERVVSGIERRFTSSRDRPAVTSARAALDGVMAYRRGSYEEAVRTLSKSAEHFQGVPMTALIQSAVFETRRLFEIKDLAGGLAAARLAARYAPRNPSVRYNAGMLGWWVARTSGINDRKWRTDLEAFIALAEREDVVPNAELDAARMMLGDRMSSLPQLPKPLTGAPVQ